EVVGAPVVGEAEDGDPDQQADYHRVGKAGCDGGQQNVQLRPTQDGTRPCGLPGHGPGATRNGVGCEAAAAPWRRIGGRCVPRERADEQRRQAGWFRLKFSDPAVAESAGEPRGGGTARCRTEANRRVAEAGRADRSTASGAAPFAGAFARRRDRGGVWRAGQWERAHGRPARRTWSHDDRVRRSGDTAVPVSYESSLTVSRPVPARPTALLRAALPIARFGINRVEPALQALESRDKFSNVRIRCQPVSPRRIVES